jgi:hypothetical protein
MVAGRLDLLGFSRPAGLGPEHGFPQIDTPMNREFASSRRLRRGGAVRRGR